MRRALALLGSAIAIGAVTVPIAASSAANPVSSCSTSKGVLVVVDFRHFGRSVTRGCDASITTSTTGFDAMQTAGFSTEGTKHDGPNFVCRIDGLPTAKQDPCFNTPPANAYWSYWHANAGQRTWSYSTKGAASSHPGPGSIDAWVFGSTDVGGSRGGPSFTPAQARSGATSSGSGGSGGGGATKPSAPRHSSQHSSHHARSHPSNAHRPAASSAPTSAGKPSAKHSASGSSARSGGLSSSPGASSASSAGPSFVDQRPASSNSKPSSGSVLPVILGLALAVLLAGGAGWTVLRRRRAEAADH